MTSSMPADLSHLTEAEIIRSAQRGDVAAFEHLYKQHSRRVYALCFRMTGNPSDAEELTQDAFLQLFRKIGTFRGEASFSTWLHRITFNIVLLRFRTRKLGEVSLTETFETEGKSDKPRNQLGQADVTLSGLVDWWGLIRAIDRLPAGCKRTFMLHDVEGYAHWEIAKILGCSIGNSKSQLHKARARLRRSLREQPEQRSCGEQPADFSHPMVAVTVS